MNARQKRLITGVFIQSFLKDVKKVLRKFETSFKTLKFELKLVLISLDKEILVFQGSEQNTW